MAFTWRRRRTCCATEGSRSGPDAARQTSWPETSLNSLLRQAIAAAGDRRGRPSLTPESRDLDNLANGCVANASMANAFIACAPAHRPQARVPAKFFAV